MKFKTGMREFRLTFIYIGHVFKSFFSIMLVLKFFENEVIPLGLIKDRFKSCFQTVQNLVSMLILLGEAFVAIFT